MVSFRPAVTKLYCMQPLCGIGFISKIRLWNLMFSLKGFMFAKVSLEISNPCFRDSHYDWKMLHGMTVFIFSFSTFILHFIISSNSVDMFYMTF